MPAALIDMTGVAAFRGVHYDTVRKGWRAWVVDEGFPAPVQMRPYGWNPESLDRWAARREAENHAAVTRAPAAADAANENRPDRPAARRIDRERGAVMALMAQSQGARA